jgi:hypothetical protein
VAAYLPWWVLSFWVRKSAQALDMPIRKARWMLSTRLPCGVMVWGVGAQRIIMKYFTGFPAQVYGSETPINQLSRVSTTVGTVGVSDHTLDYCALDLEVL